MWIALDGEFYLAVDGGRDDCLDLFDEFSNCGKLLLPTAYQEIADLSLNTQDQELQERALDALTFMAANGVLAAPHPSGNMGTDAALAEQLMRDGLVAEGQKNSALIVAECACAQVSHLLTLDPEILKIDQGTLREVILRQHLQPFEIRTVSPSEM
jgi:hypothetical protein